MPICPVLIFFDEELIAERLNDWLFQYNYATAIGSMDATNTHDGDVYELFGFDWDDPIFQEYWYTPEDMPISQADLSDTHASDPKGVNKEHLQKIRIIYEDEARRTLKMTTKLNMQDADSNLSYTFGSNDQMLRYKRIKSFFSTDTFFRNNSTRGYICMQLFVSDKGFVRVYDMKSKAKFPLALRLFTKWVGVSNAFILGPSGDQTLAVVHAF